MDTVHWLEDLREEYKLSRNDPDLQVWPGSLAENRWDNYLLLNSTKPTLNFTDVKVARGLWRRKSHIACCIKSIPFRCI